MYIHLIGIWRFCLNQCIFAEHERLSIIRRISLKFKAWSYVFIQMCGILFLLVEMELSIRNDQWVFQILGIVIGLWSIVVMQLTKFSELPIHSRAVIIVITGPYRFVRYPIYYAILLFFLPQLWIQLSIIYTAIYIVLLMSLNSKLKFEELLLVKKHTIYSSYVQNTFRLLPFVY